MRFQGVPSFQITEGLWLPGSLLPIGGATLDVDFAASRYSGIGTISTVRSTPGMAERLDGSWQEFAANVARVTDRGLLVEEQRTNAIRNNTMVGAVAGSPGTLPTNWSAGNTGSLVAQVLGTGTEKGLDYIDLRISGTANVSTSFFLEFDNASMAAAVGVATAQSLFIKRLAGTVPPNTSLNTVMRNNLDAYLGDQFAAITITDDLKRFVCLANAQTVGTTQVRARLTWPITNTTSYDVTLRIAVPQLELGTFASTPIRTSGVAVTRPIDFVTMLNGPWFNAAAGTIYAEALGWDPTTATQGLVSIDDTTVTERFQMRRSSAAGLSTVVVDDNVVVASPAVGGSFPLNTVVKAALAYALNDVNAAAAGTASTVDTVATLPTVTRIQFGAGQGTGALNGYLKRAAFYPRRLSNAELVALTT